MNGFRSLATITMLCLVIAMAADNAAGQQPGKSGKEQFVGSWTLVSIHYVHPDGNKIEPFGWDFKKKGRPIHARVEGTLIVDDIDLSIHAVLDGVGVAYLLYDYIASHIASGRLVPLLEGYSPRLSGFFLYHSNRRQVTAPLRALIDFLKTETKRRGLTPASPLGSGIYPNYRLVGPARR